MFVSTSAGGLTRLVALGFTIALACVGVVWTPSDAAESGSLPGQGNRTSAGFSAPVERQPPAIQESGWIRNPIDQFILAKLQKEHLSPAPEASHEALIR